jgi:hypothetical protein
MDIVDDEAAVDEYKEIFESLESSVSTNTDAYKELLANTRDDEVAVKIKEKCIYR